MEMCDHCAMLKTLTDNGQTCFLCYAVSRGIGHKDNLTSNTAPHNFVTNPCLCLLSCKPKCSLPTTNCGLDTRPQSRNQLLPHPHRQLFPPFSGQSYTFTTLAHVQDDCLSSHLHCKEIMGPPLAARQT